MLTLTLLGAPQCLLDGRVLRLPRRKSRALLYYVAAHPQPVLRESLLATFWLDTPRPAALQTLRTTLHGLRQELGAALVTRDEAVGLADETWVDARSFEHILAHPASDLASSTFIQSGLPGEIPRLSQALALYQGDFLAGFSLPGAQEFEDWVIVQREHYARLAVRALTALSQEHEAVGDYSSALATLERALSFNLLQEDLQREAIRLSYLAGDRPGAIRRYDELRRLLDEEMGVPPMTETRALYDAIINDRPLPAAPNRRISLPSASVSSRDAPALGATHASPQPFATPAQPITDDDLPFTGREKELRALSEISSSHRLALIEGEAGIGKTRLVQEYLRNSGAICMVGGARELEQSLPYHPVIEALRALLSHPDWPVLKSGLRQSLPAIWLAEASRLLPELAGELEATAQTVRAADEPRLWEGLGQFLGALSGQRRLALFIDDLQWADASTLGLMGFLVRQLQSSPVFFLAALRSIPLRSPLASLVQSLTREDRLVRIQLNPLRPEDVEGIAQSVCPSGAGELAEWLQRVSEGNPYFMVEVLHYARTNRLLGEDGKLDPSLHSGEVMVPPTVYSLIQSRLEHLSDPARRVLDVGVAAGREFDFGVAQLASGLSESAALDALDELKSAHLIRPAGEERFAFDHSLTMEVAFREVGKLRHHLLHRRVAEALESLNRENTGPVAGELAWHFSEGQDLKRAAPYAFQAGQQAARLAAWTEAVAFYEQALNGLPRLQQLPVWMALGEAHSKAGRFAKASEAYREALNLAGSEAALVDQISLALARSLLPQARFLEAIALARRVRQHGRKPDLCAAELIWGAALSIEGSDLEEAAEHLEAARSLCSGNEADDLATQSQAQFELGSIAAQQGDLPRAVAFYRESLATATQLEQESGLERRILAYNNLAYHLLLSGDPAAKEYALAGLSLAEEKGALGLQAYLYSTLGEIALANSDLDEAEGDFQKGLALAEQFSIPERVAGLTANLGLVAIQRGQNPLAIHRLSTALGLADALGTRHLAAQVRLWLAPLLPPEEARFRLAEVKIFAQASRRQRLLNEAARLEALSKL